MPIVRLVKASLQRFKGNATVQIIHLVTSNGTKIFNTPAVQFADLQSGLGQSMVLSRES